MNLYIKPYFRKGFLFDVIILFTGKNKIIKTKKKTWSHEPLTKLNTNFFLLESFSFQTNVT